MFKQGAELLAFKSSPHPRRDHLICPFTRLQAASLDEGKLKRSGGLPSRPLPRQTERRPNCLERFLEREGLSFPYQTGRLRLF